MPLEKVAYDPFSHGFDPAIESTAAKYGIPEDRLRAVIEAESNFNPNAVSKAGAHGLMQLMPETAAKLGVTNMFDPEQNLDAGARYLRTQYDRFGDWDLAHAAYNAGPGAVERHGGVPPYPETRAYVDKINARVGSSDDEEPGLAKVDYDPFAKDEESGLTKVDHDPFATEREVAPQEALERGLKAAGQGAIFETRKAVAGLGMALDWITHAFGGTSDYADEQFKKMAVAQAEIEKQGPQPGEKFGDVAGGIYKAVSGLGPLASQLAQGGPAAVEAAGVKAAMPLGARALEESAGPLAQVAQNVRAPILTATPVGTSAAESKYQELIQGGVDPARATILASVAGVTSQAQMGVPLSVGSEASTILARIASRALQGGVASGVMGEGIQRLENELVDVLRVDPRFKHDPDTSDRIANVLVGMVLGQGGHGRTGEPPRSRAELGYGEPETEPAPAQLALPAPTRVVHADGTVTSTPEETAQHERQLLERSFTQPGERPPPTVPAEPLQLEHYAEPTMAVSPEGEVITAAEWRQRQIEARDFRGIDSRFPRLDPTATPPDVMGAHSADEAIASAGAAIELDLERTTRITQEHANAARIESAAGLDVRQQTGDGEALGGRDAQYQEPPGAGGKAIGETRLDHAGNVEVGPTPLGRMTDRELNAAAQLTRSEERRAALLAERDRRVAETPSPAALEVPEKQATMAQVAQAAGAIRSGGTTQAHTAALDAATEAARSAGVTQPEILQAIRENRNARPVEGAARPAAGAEAKPAEARGVQGTEIPNPKAEPENAAPRPQGVAGPSQAKEVTAPPAFQDFQTRLGEVKVFKTAKTAQAYQKQPTNRVPGNFAPRRGDDGQWLLSRPVIERSAAQKNNDLRLARERANINDEKDSLATMMGKAGGIKADELLKDGVDKASLKDLRSGVVGKPAYRTKGGLTLDAMAEILAEHGFSLLDEHGTVDATKLRALIQEELDGTFVFTSQGHERNAALADEQRALEDRHRIENELPEETVRQSGYHDLSPDGQDTVSQIFDDGLDAQMNALWDGTGKVLTNEEADRLFGNTTEVASNAESAAAGRAREGAKRGEETPHGQEEPAPLELKGETEAEIRAREASQSQSEAEQKKREGAPAPSDFALTGSERPVDEARARGQHELTSIADFGEKIGGARKDTAQPLGTRGIGKTQSDEPGWRKRFSVSEVVKSSEPGEAGKWVIHDLRREDWRGQPRQIGEPFATKEAAEKGAELAAVAQKHRVVMGSPDKDGKSTYTIWRDVTDRKRVQVVQDEFQTREAAMRYMAEHAVGILDTKTNFGEEILAKPDEVQRTGAERRTGPATAPMFQETFGFRGVEFGKWNNQAERQEVMNHAYDGLLDLADVLDVPPKALSLNGDLGLAFGARGQGLSGARAHYESEYGVINLTKMSGAGALAHEWLHAADHYLGRQDGKTGAERVKNVEGHLVYETKGASDFASHGFRVNNSGVREEVRSAYKDLIQTLFTKAEKYVEDTQRAEKFVGASRDGVAQKLQEIRNNLTLGPESLTYMKRNNRPASAEQLASFDQLADKLISGADLKTMFRYKNENGPASHRDIMGGRHTNDTLEAISALMKEVRGRSGFNSEHTGSLDSLRANMSNYAARIKMLDDANAKTEKTKRVPTSYAMDAKRIDQGRASDYWTTEHEMAARAFSAYVEDKIAERGNRSDFLSFGSSNDRAEYRILNVRPFPEGAERQAMDVAFDKFFKVLKTKETDKGVALFARTEQTEPGMAVEDVHKVLEPMRASWKNGPEIVVVKSMDDPLVPAIAREKNAAQKSQGAAGQPKAFFYDGKVFIVANEHHSPVEVVKTTFHEALLHFGIRGAFGDRLNNVLSQIASARSADVNAKAKRYGLDVNDPKERLLAAEEVLAELAETRPTIGFVRNAIAAIRTFLRDHGFDLELSDDEIVRNFLVPARNFVERGAASRGEAQAELAFARTGAAPTAREARGMPDWVKGMKPDMRETLRKAGAWVDEKNAYEKIRDWAKDDVGMKVLQSTLDQFAPFKRISMDAYKTLRMVANSTTGGLEAALLYGRPKMNDAGVLDVEKGTKGLIEALKPLNGEVERFLSWVAGNRAAQLKLEDREHLFSDDDIARLKSLDRKTAADDNFPNGEDGKGRPAAYAKALTAYNAHSRAILDIAERAGIINGESRGVWEKQFYVPFFREEEEGTKAGPAGNLSGMVNQYSFKRLKGGEEVLSDLLSNTLQNWSHLLNASLKNNAAREALVAAVKIGVAEKLKAAEKGSVFILENGKEVNYRVDDPMVAAAISSLGASPFRGKIMESMGWFKHILTVGTTMSPVFRLRHTIREQLTALASNPKGWNPVANWIDGFKYSSRDNPEYGSMLAGGSFFRFGQDFDGERAAFTKRLIAEGIDKTSLLDSPNAVRAMAEHAWDWWKETGERSDSITRANRYRDTYKMVLDKGGTPDEAHKEASYQALDTMDYGLRGTAPAIRMVTQVVPFMNARMQGLYKLGRAAVDNPKRFAAVVGGLTLASIALSLAYRDDKDWKNREEWDRDNNWWFKIGDKAYRVPKPFELGALATVVDRALEVAMNGFDRDTRERFAKRLLPLVASQLSLNPIPQAVFPALELWANKDVFTGRSIESPRDENLSVSQRIGAHTTFTAQLAGKAGVLSPEQIDFLVNAYLGWVGAHAVATADLAFRPLFGATSKPAPKVDDYFLVGDFVKSMPSNQSRFVEQYYEHLKEVQQAMGDIRMFQQTGQIEKARLAMVDNREKLQEYGVYSKAQQTMAQINKRIRFVNSSNVGPDEKAAQLDRLYQMRNTIAQTVEARRH